jgi:hypothetical protein
MMLNVLITVITDKVSEELVLLLDIIDAKIASYRHKNVFLLQQEYSCRHGKSRLYMCNGIDVTHKKIFQESLLVFTVV